jgi:signal transduction histidine kinase
MIAAIEACVVGARASILVLDAAGERVMHRSAPRLPPDYIAAIDGQPIGPAAGSCGTAAYRGEPVYVTDIATDPLWAGYRELASRFGLRSCWSSPILASTRRVLGTFALYHDHPREADASTRELLQRASHVAGIVLERRALDEELRALAARIEATREQERTAIARDIHDQLGQALTALKLDIGWLSRRVQDASQAERLREMGRSTDEVIRTVQRIATELRSALLDEVGLEAAIESEIEEFQIRTGVCSVLDATIGDICLERHLATTIFRVFQEALTNVARHASAKELQVTLRLEHGNVVLEVADDGVGIPDVGPRSNLGILGMRERARQHGGDCTVRRRDPKGTLVTLTMPLRFPEESPQQAV